jgi:hypothetical protein
MRWSVESDHRNAMERKTSDTAGQPLALLAARTASPDPRSTTSPVVGAGRRRAAHAAPRPVAAGSQRRNHRHRPWVPPCTRPTPRLTTCRKAVSIRPNGFPMARRRPVRQRRRRRSGSSGRRFTGHSGMLSGLTRCRRFARLATAGACQRRKEPSARAAPSGVVEPWQVAGVCDHLGLGVTWPKPS